MSAQEPIPASPGDDYFVVEPPRRIPKLALGELWRYRSVGTALTRRNLKARYRQTLLGVVWVLLQPLLLMLVLSIFFSWFARDGYDGIPYAAWFITGLTIWGPAIKVVSEGATSLTANQQLILRVYLPRPLIPISVALTTLVDLAFTFTAMVVILLLFGYTPSLLYLALPFFIVIAYMTMVGAGFFLSALNVTFRDVQVAIPFTERVWFFMSPLLYPVQLVPEQLWPLYYLNPMALVLTGFHWVLLDVPPPPLWAFAEGTIVAVLCLVVGYFVFKRREPAFADML